MLSLDLPTFLSQTLPIVLLFFVLWGILSSQLFKPALQRLDRQEQHLESLKREAERLRQEAERIQGETQDAFAQARREVLAGKDQRLREAGQEAERVLGEAARQARDIGVEARDRAAREAAALRKALAPGVGEWADRLMSRLLPS
ncbi:MAG: hypothetical protein HYY13_12600 [Nitrospirae bacterium]|nr:hypothetical protein [Nitrospirota bacterium]